ncbi:MAG: hypothetical protein HMLIMOIP_002710 [Candidatus Nitrosomirales archaeon]|jgi:hypothetical protein
MDTVKGRQLDVTAIVQDVKGSQDVKLKPLMEKSAGGANGAK